MKTNNLSILPQDASRFNQRQRERVRLFAEKIWANASCAFDLLLVTPLGNQSVVAAREHLWHVEPTPRRRLRVARVFEQAVRV
jgi:hypothetical protein